MNNKYIILKSGTIIRNDITAIAPYKHITHGLLPHCCQSISSNIAGYSVLFRNGQTVPITIDDYEDLKERLK